MNPSASKRNGLIIDLMNIGKILVRSGLAVSITKIGKEISCRYVQKTVYLAHIIFIQTYFRVFPMAALLNWNLQGCLLMQVRYNQLCWNLININNRFLSIE